MEKITEQLITEKFITELPIDHIFVFGSNSAGIHGAGAARIALLFFNAKTGVGNGLTGQSYAIPTKNEHIRSNSLRVIDIFVKQFIHYIETHPHYIYHVTPIGCGYAGYEAKDIAPMFESLRFKENVYLPQEFINIYNKQ